MAAQESKPSLGDAVMTTCDPREVYIQTRKMPNSIASGMILLSMARLVKPSLLRLLIIDSIHIVAGLL